MVMRYIRGGLFQFVLERTAPIIHNFMARYFSLRIALYILGTAFIILNIGDQLQKSLLYSIIKEQRYSATMSPPYEWFIESRKYYVTFSDYIWFKSYRLLCISAGSTFIIGGLFTLFYHQRKKYVVLVKEAYGTDSPEYKNLIKPLTPEDIVKRSQTNPFEGPRIEQPTEEHQRPRFRCQPEDKAN